MNGNSSLGVWLKERRKSLDLTQEELAIRIGCSLEMVQKIESGSRKPSKQMSELLADCLGVEPIERSTFVRFARGKAGPDRPHAREGQAPHNLPAALTPFIGRASDVEAVCSYIMREDVRLLTVTGPPGIGKTRLGVQAGYELLSHFEDGVFLVLLAPIVDPQLVLSTVGRTIGLTETPGKSTLDGLVKYLQGKRLLLLLDNFEQVVSAAPDVAALLERCSDLRILVTSREPLHLQGEQQYPVPPLLVPPSVESLALDELASYPAIALFLQTAKAVKPDFELTTENAEAVRTICEDLDGLPLAIELVAARVKLLTPNAIASRLNHRLSLLVGGPRNLPARHQTLRDAIGWSYDLLGTWEQVLFLRLGIFVGGCSLDAIEAVCNATGDLPLSVLEAVESLLDKSLLRQQQSSDGEPRFWMLETIREYAGERLDESGERDAIARLHAEYYLALAEVAGPQFTRGEFKRWAAHLDQEMNNIRAALDWAYKNDAELGMRLAAALWLYWETTERSVEGQERLARLLAHPAANRRTIGRARALSAAAFLATVGYRDLEAAQKLGHEGLAIGRELGDEWTIAYAILCLAFPGEGTYPQNRPLLDEALGICREMNDEWGIGSALHHKGAWALLDGDGPGGRALIEQALGLFRETREPFAITSNLKTLGSLELAAGNLAAARTIYEEVISIKKEWGNRQYLAGWLCTAGNLARLQGEYETAENYFKKGLTTAYQARSEIGAARALLGLASLSGENGDWERVAMLLGAAKGLPKASAKSAIASDPQMNSEYVKLTTMSRDRLSDVDWQKATDEGSALDFEAAVACALDSEP